MGRRTLRAAAGAAAFLLAAVASSAAQTGQIFHACYVPQVGALYVIKLDGLPSDCLAEDHVEIKWTEGGLDLPDGVVTDANLASSAVTTAKLADAAVSTAKLADGAVTAAKLGADLPAGVSAHGGLDGLDGDDHPQYLLANGARAAPDGFAVTGASSSPIPVEGEGARLMWYAAKAAFRAGGVDGTEWNDENVGFGSTALGINAMASGVQSTAMGGSTTASGDFATAMGRTTTASGEYSTAIGLSTTASAGFSTAMGRGTRASGEYATALSISTTASGDRSTAIGSNTTASGTASTAMGFSTTASGDGSTAMGVQTTAAAFASLVIGRRPLTAGNATSWVPTDHLFVAGNGTLTGNVRSNALELYKNGTLVIAGSFFENSDIRDKEDIVPVGGVLDRVLSLTPIRYRFRPGTGHPETPKLGLSAQQVEPLFPELVSRDGAGRLSVAYADLSAVLVRAIQEQQRELDALRAEMAALRAEIGRLGGQPEP